MQVAIFAFAAIVNIKRFDGDITLAILGNGDIFHSFNFQNANAISFHARLFRKVANGFVDEGGNEFFSWCIVIEEHNKEKIEDFCEIVNKFF